MKKYADIFLICIFILILAAPLVFMNTTEGAISDTDGRTLLSRPELGSEEFRNDTEAYIRDRLLLGDNLFTGYASVNDKLFGELINPAYQYGKDNYTFPKLHDNLNYSYFHTQFANMLSLMQKYCESRGSEFIYVFIPEKESVYRDSLPEGVNYDDTWADMMLAYLDKLGVNYIDLRGPLTKASHEEDIFNRLIDAGHWNQNGAFYGMKEITKRLKENDPEVEVLNKSEYDISEVQIDKMASSNQIFNEMVPSYSLKSEVTYDSDIISELKINNSSPGFQLAYTDSDEADAINRMLVFQDDLYPQFAVSRAKETVSVTCIQNAIDFEYYYNIFKPETVIFESMEYVINSGYFSEEAMSALDPNPAIIKLFPEKGFASRHKALLKKTRHYDSNAVVLLKSQDKIDKVYVSRKFTKCKYAYLITDKSVYDLKDDGTGLLYADIRHKEIPEGSEVTLYISDEKGEGRYDTLMVTSKSKPINIELVKHTDNISSVEDGNTFIMSMKTDGNSFNKVALQMYDSDITEYIREIESSDSEGHHEGVFCHTSASGDYKILLKGNSNLQDEWIAYNVSLIKGRVYKYSFDVDEFSGSSITVSNFNISVPKSTKTRRTN